MQIFVERMGFIGNEATCFKNQQLPNIRSMYKVSVSAIFDFSLLEIAKLFFRKKGQYEGK